MGASGSVVAAASLHGPEDCDACFFVDKCRALRAKYKACGATGDCGTVESWEMADNGVAQLFGSDGAALSDIDGCTYKDFVHDYTALCDMCHSGPLRSYAYRRMTLMQTCFEMHEQFKKKVTNHFEII